MRSGFRHAHEHRQTKHVTHRKCLLTITDRGNNASGVRVHHVGEWLRQLLVLGVERHALADVGNLVRRAAQAAGEQDEEDDERQDGDQSDEPNLLIDWHVRVGRAHRRRRRPGDTCTHITADKSVACTSSTMQFPYTRAKSVAAKSCLTEKALMLCIYFGLAWFTALNSFDFVRANPPPSLLKLCSDSSITHFFLLEW